MGGRGGLRDSPHFTTTSSPHCTGHVRASLCCYTEKRAPKTKSLVLDEAIEAKLREFYAPFNRKLYELLGRDLGWEGMTVAQFRLAITSKLGAGAGSPVKLKT